MALVKKLQERYHYSLVVLKELVKTDFKLRYQGSFLGIGWSVLQPLMLFAKFLRMSDGTPTYPVVLLMGISAWQFVQESTSVGLRAIVDRGDLLRKIHFPNYIVVVASTIGALISFAINFVVVLLFALFTHVHFTWRVLLLPLNFIQLYIIALGLALILATMYVYFRDILHIWDVLQQVLFYSMPIIYPLAMVIGNQSLRGYGPLIAKIQLLNPIAQVIQDIRHNLIAPETQPTIWTMTTNPLLRAIPILILVLGVYVFKRNNRKFAEVM